MFLGSATPNPNNSILATARRIAERTGPMKEDLKRYSVLRALRAVDDQKSLNGVEAEVQKEMELALGRSARPGGILVPTCVQSRGLATDSYGGGYLVGTQVEGSQFIDMLRSKLSVAALGARLISGLRGNVSIPRQTGTATAHWLANENTPIGESSPTIDQVLISPKNVAALTQVSRQLTLQSSPDAESLIMNDLAQVVALAIDTAAITGDGLAGSPKGIMTTDDVGTFTGTSLGYAGLLAAQSGLAALNALDGRPGYLTTPTVASKLAQRQRFTGTDSPLWEGNISNGKVAGFNATSSTAVPADTMVFGNFEDMIVADWGVIELMTDPYTNFQKGIIGVRAWATVDIAIRRPESFTVATSIT